MNTTGPHQRDWLGRIIDRIGCFVVLLPIVATTIVVVSEVFRVPVALLVLGLLVFMSLGGPTPPPSSKKTGSRNGAVYVRTRRILDAYDDGRISEAERDKRLQELTHD